MSYCCRIVTRLESCVSLYGLINERDDGKEEPSGPFLCLWSWPLIDGSRDGKK